MANAGNGFPGFAPGGGKRLASGRRASRGLAERAMAADHSDLIAPARFTNQVPTTFVDAVAQPPPKYSYTEERPQTRGARAG